MSLRNLLADEPGGASREGFCIDPGPLTGVPHMFRGIVSKMINIGMVARFRYPIIAIEMRFLVACHCQLDLG